MAEEYVIRIRAEGDAREDNIPVSMPSGGAVVTPKAPQVAGAGDVGVPLKLSKMLATSALVPAATALASTSVSMIGLSTGNNKLQQKINTGMSVFSKISSLGSGAMAGFAIGGVPGAIVGVAAVGITQAAEVAGTAIRHNIEYTNEQYRLGIARERAGIMTDRRR